MSNSGLNKPVLPGKKQKGAVMVETALTLSLFMLLLLAIFEVALLFFDWSRAVEATRTTARTLIVSNPPIDVSGLTCEDADTSSTSFTCGEADCGLALERAQGIAPMLSGDNVRVTYQCTSAGFPDRPELLPIFTLMVELEGFTSTLRIPALIGFPADIPMPGFKTSRTTEDLYTPTG